MAFNAFFTKNIGNHLTVHHVETVLDGSKELNAQVQVERRNRGQNNHKLRCAFRDDMPRNLGNSDFGFLQRFPLSQGRRNASRDPNVAAAPRSNCGCKGLEGSQDRGENIPLLLTLPSSLLGDCLITRGTGTPGGGCGFVIAQVFEATACASATRRGGPGAGALT